MSSHCGGERVLDRRVPGERQIVPARQRERPAVQVGRAAGRWSAGDRPQSRRTAGDSIRTTRPAWPSTSPCTGSHCTRIIGEPSSRFDDADELRRAEHAAVPFEARREVDHADAAVGRRRTSSRSTFVLSQIAAGARPIRPPRRRRIARRPDRAACRRPGRCRIAASSTTPRRRWRESARRTGSYRRDRGPQASRMSLALVQMCSMPDQYAVIGSAGGVHCHPCPSRRPVPPLNACITTGSPNGADARGQRAHACAATPRRDWSCLHPRSRIVAFGGWSAAELAAGAGRGIRRAGRRACALAERARSRGLRGRFLRARTRADGARVDRPRARRPAPRAGRASLRRGSRHFRARQHLRTAGDDADARGRRDAGALAAGAGRAGRDARAAGRRSQELAGQLDLRERVAVMGDQLKVGVHAVLAAPVVRDAHYACAAPAPALAVAAVVAGTMAALVWWLRTSQLRRWFCWCWSSFS